MAINRKEQGMSEDTPKSELQRKLEILINTEKLEEIYGIPDHLMSKMIISFIDSIGKFDPLAKIKAIEEEEIKEPECKHKNPETVVICPYCSTGNKREYVGDPNNSDAINKITRCRSCNSSFIYLLDNPYRVYGKMVGIDGGYDK